MSVSITYGTENIKEAVALTSDILNNLIKSKKVSTVSIGWMLFRKLGKINSVIAKLPEIKKEVMDLDGKERENLKNQIKDQVEGNDKAEAIAEGILTLLVELSSVFSLIKIIKK